MIINESSQLGLRFAQRDVALRFVQAMQNELNEQMDVIGYSKEKLMEIETDVKDDEKDPAEVVSRLRMYLKEKAGIDTMYDVEVNQVVHPLISVMEILVPQKAGTQTRKYLICDSVWDHADLVHLGENFTGTIFGKIKPGGYTYLMGKHEMMQMVVKPGAIRGIIFRDDEMLCVEFCIDTNTGHWSTSNHEEAFVRMMKIMVYVELGEITIKELPPGRNNGKTRAKGKVTNDYKATVWVVDFTWNQVIVRSEEFSVRPHFRLQACGHAYADRRLTFIDGYIKEGYTRRAKATIVHNQTGGTT